MKYLVTGACGFIGHNLIKTLVVNNESFIYCVDNESGGNQKINHPRVRYFKKDISDYKSLDIIFNALRPDYVFHMAAESRVGTCEETPEKAINTNILGTLNVLRLAKKYGTKRVIYSSTSATYGRTKELPTPEHQPSDNLGIYSVTKIAGEDLCMMYYKTHGLDTVALRYFNVFGEGMPEKGQYAPVIAIFLKQRREGKDLTVVGDGNQTRDFVYVKDVVNANILSAYAPPIQVSGKIMNVGTSTSYSVLQIAKAISHKIKHIPPRPGESPNTLADSTLLRSATGWKPTVDVIDWIKDIK